MRKAAYIFAVLTMCAACAWAGGIDSKLIKVALTGTATGGTNTPSKITGYIESVQVACTDGVSTGLVNVAIVPADSTVAAIVIATNTVIDEDVWRPRVDITDIAGAAITGDEPVRYLLKGESIRFIVTGSATTRVWHCRVKLSDQ